MNETGPARGTPPTSPQLGHGTTLSKMRSLRRLDRLLFWYCPTPLGTSAAGTRATCRGRQYGTDVQQPPLSLLRR